MSHVLPVLREAVQNSLISSKLNALQVHCIDCGDSDSGLIRDEVGIVRCYSCFEMLNESAL